MNNVGAVMAAAIIGGLAVLSGGPAVAQPVDRHEGYYYPAVSSHEEYISRAQTLKDSTRTRRLGFVSGLTQQLAEQPFPPPYAIFAKGDDAKRLIIVAFEDGHLNTVYR